MDLALLKYLKERDKNNYNKWAPKWLILNLFYAIVEQLLSNFDR
jgi:hypothetical protein